MDVSKYMELRIAPRALFDALPERKDRPRFMLRDATTGGWSPVTWQAFADETRDIALYLAGAGLEPGDRVAIYAPNSVAWAAAALAIQAAGGVMVPVYPASTKDQLAYVLGHADAKFVFVDTPALLARVRESWKELPALEHVVVLDDGVLVAGAAAGAGEDARVVAWSQARAAGAKAHAADPVAIERLMDAVTLDQFALMLYTSGTTGHPKGVPLSHRNIAVNGRDWLECNAPLLDEGAIDVLWLPMSHIFGLGEMCLGNTLGWISYMSDPREVLERLPEVQPHVFMSVPSHWEKIAQNVRAAVGDDANAEEHARALGTATGGRLRFCLSGGAGLKREVKELFHAAGVLILEGYGLTETSPTLTLNRPGAFRFDSVGKPLPSVQIELAPDGEILAKGPNVFAGYHKDPAATREIFTDDGWLKTGDVGRWTDDGFLQIIDRKKDILVTAGGKNVPPANIEMRFAGDPLVAHVVVYGDGKKFLVAGLWPNEEVARSMSAGELEAALHERVDAVNAELPSYETIKRFGIMRTPLTVEGGLLTASFKVRRKKIYETYQSDFERLYQA